MLKSKNTLKLFDRVVSLLKRLGLDTDLNDNEGADLAEATDRINEVREKYVDRKVDDAVRKLPV